MRSGRLFATPLILALVLLAGCGRPTIEAEPTKVHHLPDLASFSVDASVERVRFVWDARPCPCPALADTLTEVLTAKGFLPMPAGQGDLRVRACTFERLQKGRRGWLLVVDLRGPGDFAPFWSALLDLPEPCCDPGPEARAALRLQVESLFQGLPGRT